MASTCPNCGADVTADVPEESIRHQLSALIDSGASADAATDEIVANLPAGFGPYVRPAVRQEARGIARDHDRRIEKATIGTSERWARKSADMRKKLLEVRFSLGGGIEVTWGKATRPQHEQRIKLLDEQTAGIGDTRRRHMLAIELIDAAGVDCLDEVTGGEQVLTGLASGEVESDLGSTARKPRSRTNAPGKRTGQGKNRQAA